MVLGERLEGVGDASAREALEDLDAVALEAGVPAEPERRVGGEREDMASNLTTTCERQHSSSHFLRLRQVRSLARLLH